MEYLIPILLVVLVVTGFVLAVTFYSMRKGGAGEADRNADDSRDARPGMGADAKTDLGDTDQLSQDQTGGEVARSGRFDHDGTPRQERVPDHERLADRPA